MIGLGPGARSYTACLHYSSDYAVSGVGVRNIISEFNQQDEKRFAVADYGVWLNHDEQCRRYLIRSLLQTNGLDRKGFHNKFGGDVRHLLPRIEELIEQGYAELTNERLQLNADGLAHSDVIGPWLYSESVRRQMEQFELR